MVGALTLKLVQVFGGNDKQLGYQYTVTLMAVIGVLLFLVCFAFTRERVPPVTQEKQVRQDFKTRIQGRAWWMMALMGICVYTALSITSGSMIYYFKYVAGDALKVSGYFFIAGIGLLTGILVSVVLTKKYCKRKVMMAAAPVATLLYISFYFIDPKNIALVYGLAFCIQTFNGISVPILWFMVADTADDAELQLRRRMVGLTTSSIAFSHKFGLGIGGAIAGLLLVWIGYQTSAQQTPETMHALIVIMSLIPALGKVLVVLVLKFYPLDQSRLDEIQPLLQRARSRPH